MFTLFGNDFCEGYSVEQGNFPDGTLNMKLPMGHVDTVCWEYENDAELFALICIARHYESTILNLYMPYVPNARMDRVKKETDVFILKYFCEIINSLNFQNVYVLDVHSNVSLALLDRVKAMTPENCVMKAISYIRDENNIQYESIQQFNQNFMLFFPDEGAMKRYSDMFPGYNYTFGVKSRDWETGKIQKLTIMDAEMIKDKTILIIDDICSYGGTFNRASKALKEAGAGDIYLYVSHAENSMVKGDMYNGDDVKHIFTTSSIFDVEGDFKNKVTVL